MEAVVALANSLTSPAKLAFGAYVLLLWLESQNSTFHFSRCEFLVAALLFATVQIAHDDWLRFILNKHAERVDLAKRKKLQLIRKDELAPDVVSSLAPAAPSIPPTGPAE